MNFLNELEAHLESFETKAKEEIQKFIAHVKSKYSEPAPAVVAAPAPIAPNGELTIGQPAVEAFAVETPVAEVEAAPVVEEAAPEAPVAEEPATAE